MSNNNPGSAGTWRYNKRIADLYMSEWNAYRIWQHIINDEKAVFDTFPISFPTILRRLELFRANHSDMVRLYDNEMTEAERTSFMIKVKLMKPVKKGK